MKAEIEQRQKAILCEMKQKNTLHLILAQHYDTFLNICLFQQSHICYHSTFAQWEEEEKVYCVAIVQHTVAK